MSMGAPGIRYAEVERETKETKVQVVLDLDGGSRQDVDTGIGFLDHMLKLMAFHGSFDLGVQCEGDLRVEDHHTVEDVGIVMGQAFKQAVDGSYGLVRYASNHSPMDDALVVVAVDISGRGYLVFDVPFTRETLGSLHTENVREFFQAFAMNAGITLHFHKIAGFNDHHLCEACFKGLGRAIHAATMHGERKGVSSTKGVVG
jgi:imidazoleglycerol-phosphate dehydratase